MRAVILGGTGALGVALAQRLGRAGWRVEVTGRNPQAMPPELVALGVRFHRLDRSEYGAINALVAADTTLLLDLLAYRAVDLRALFPALAAVQCPVVVSSRAVYVDGQGRHLNGGQIPHFPIPLTESQPTVAAAIDGMDPFSRAGYAPSKVAVEQAALDSGLPITILRPSKVHGRWARNARTRDIVQAMCSGAEHIVLPQGDSIDHLSAATNIAALIHQLVDRPAARILNSADPDTPTARHIVQAIAGHLDWSGSIENGPALAATVANPWSTTHPCVLDTSAAAALGYRPVDTGAQLLAEEVRWVASTLR